MKNRKNKMEQTMVEEKTMGVEIVPSIAVWKLRDAIHRRLIDRDVGRFCNVVVTHNGKHLELSGTVDSLRTHAEILSLIPDMEQCVAHDIEVISSPLSYRFAG
jgi:hypothetical protein